MNVAYRLFLIAVLTLTACQSDSRPAVDAATDSTPPDTTTAVPSGVAGPNVFDPGAVAVGDTIAGLRITALDVHRVFEDSVWSGTVDFSGPVELEGVYLRHFDYPEPKLLCFHVAGESIDRVPRFVPDNWTSPNGKTWFCFTNQERALELLGDAATPREATVVVDKYRLVRQFTDAFATAELVSVKRIGAESRNTLTDR